jgi:hypothetical protein
MESQQIVDYIRQTLEVGHAESDVRSHLLASGWPQAAVDDAFTRYRQSESRVARKDTHKQGPKRLKVVSLKRRWQKAVGLALIVGLVGFGVHLATHHVKTPVAAAQSTHIMTDSEKRRSDVLAVAGGMGQFSTTNGVLPAKTVAAGSGLLEFCGDTCDPANPDVVQLMLYSAANVRIVPFVAGLPAPGTSTMLVVTAGKCNSGALDATAATKPRSAVLLYSDMVKDSLTAHCITL